MNRKRFRTAAIFAALRIMLVAWFVPSTALASALETHTYGGREMLVYVPSALPAAGMRALVVVLHGGLGNAKRIATRQSESALNLDDVAQKDGFIVAYLNGTPVTRHLGDKFLGWNAGGGCCGQAFERSVDDVAYVGGAVDELVHRYGIDRSKVFGIGHSNGAMLTQRMLCETSVFAAGIAISGPLNLPTSRCAAASGKRVLAIHGANDQNVPVAGGVGSKGLSGLNYRSEEESRRVFEASGATYTLQIVPDTDHFLDHVDAAITKVEGIDIPTKAAAFFGLAGAKP